ncbi:MAG: Flp family type IVb pilin [Chloroflexi bacterium]|nr:Flp family type IVb pilin [Chloroflexota bacterium]
MQFISDERGIQHAEEGLLLALIAVALTAAATTLKGGIENVFTTANTKMATS